MVWKHTKIKRPSHTYGAVNVFSWKHLHRNVCYFYERSYNDLTVVYDINLRLFNTAIYCESYKF